MAFLSVLVLDVRPDHGQSQKFPPNITDFDPTLDPPIKTFFPSSDKNEDDDVYCKKPYFLVYHAVFVVAKLLVPTGGEHFVD